MSKGIIFAIVIALLISVYGYMEYRVGRNSNKIPASLDIGELEAKHTKLANYHIRLGEHIKMYSESIFMKKGNRVRHLYYPVISKIQYNSLLPHLRMKRSSKLKIAVLVRTKEFKKIDDIPNEDITEKSLQGLVINEIRMLSREEKSLLQKTYPNSDFEKVFILEEGRVPSSVAKALFILFGALSVAIGFFVIGMKSRAKQKKVFTARSGF